MVKVLVRREERALELRLAAPPANVLDMEMIAELCAALEENDDPRLSAIIFEGEGPNFSFGASVEEHRVEKASAMLTAFHGLFRKLASISVPTFAVVRGRCLGGGMELAAWCSFVFAHPEAQLGQPEIKLAVFPPLASLLLPWRIGGGHALDLCISGRSISGVEGKAIGLIHQIGEHPAALCRAFIEQRIATTSASSLRFAERAVRAELYQILLDRLPQLERSYLGELMATHDANEGIAAFLQKRRPTWT